jgi:AcrR family transcriptional regulator
MMMAATRGPSLEAPESRDKILEAAEGLFAYGGYAGVGMRQLAALVGLSKSSLFHHFPTKLELYAAVLDREVERIERALDRVAMDDGAPVAQLEAWIDAIVTTLAEHVPAGRLLMRVLVDEEPFPAIRVGALAAGASAHDSPDGDPGRERLAFERRLDAILARVAGLLERGIAEGAFRPVPIADALLNVIGATVFYFASGDLGEAMIGESIFSKPAVERRRREVTQFVVRGLIA